MTRDNLYGVTDKALTEIIVSFLNFVIVTDYKRDHRNSKTGPSIYETRSSETNSASGRRGWEGSEYGTCPSTRGTSPTESSTTETSKTRTFRIEIFQKKTLTIRTLRNVKMVNCRRPVSTETGSERTRSSVGTVSADSRGSGRGKTISKWRRTDATSECRNSNVTSD